jgi:succinoglycan biosynthesis protein ExoM
MTFMSGRERPAPGTPLALDHDAETLPPGRPGARDHIGVCLCTFKRPSLLTPLLEKLEGQETRGLFGMSLHVVDNDVRRSAEAPVTGFARRSRVPVTYDNEPVQNIALARNRAVRVAEGNLLAFLDDDELPADDWLLQLHIALRRSGAAGVLGPVRPKFPPEAPSWLVKSGLCDRPSHATGTVLTFLQTRTGNALIDRRIIESEDRPFPAERGLTGGEDIAFFRAMMARGHRFVWCEEAPVYEIVLPERFRRAYYVQKSLRIGGLSGAKIHDLKSGKWPLLLKSGCAIAGYGVLSVASAAVGPHAVMKRFTKMVYHLGRVAGGLGFVPITKRQEY